MKFVIAYIDELVRNTRYNMVNILSNNMDEKHEGEKEYYNDNNIFFAINFSSMPLLNR